MFSDPIYLTSVAATAFTNAASAGAGSALTTFTCTGRGPNSSTYRYTIDSSHFIDLLISRQVGKRTRYTARLTETELVTDPIDSELKSQKTTTIYFVADVGVLGVGTNWAKMGTMLGSFLYKLSDTDPFLARLLLGET